MPSPHFAVQAECAQQELATEPFQHWTVPGRANAWCEFRRLPKRDAFHLRFPELADFEVRNGGQSVAAFPVPGVDPDTVEHLYLNQVLPLALNLQGAPVFHGSAVALSEDGATAFLGASGHGKSTLATYLTAQGATLYSDDALVVALVQAGCLLHPSHPSVRLWQDSLNALGSESLPAGRTIAYNSKVRIPAEAGRIRMAVHPTPLRRAYFLGDGQADSVQLRAITGHAAALRWIEHAFVLDVRDPATMKANLEHAAWLANLGISYELDYPRDFAFLPAVRHALMEADPSTP